MNLGGDTTQPSTAFIKGYSGVYQHLLQRDLPAFLSHFSNEVINWFTHDLKYLLNIYYMTATFLSTEDSHGKKKSIFHGTSVGQGETYASVVWNYGSLSGEPRCRNSKVSYLAPEFAHHGFYHIWLVRNSQPGGVKGLEK